MSSCPAQIRPGVFLGSATHAHDEAALRALEITDVLNTTREIPNAFEQTATAAIGPYIRPRLQPSMAAAHQNPCVERGHCPLCASEALLCATDRAVKGTSRWN